MSSSTPGPRRRRIAGERKSVTRPVTGSPETPTSGKLATEAPPRADDRVTAAPPQPAATEQEGSRPAEERARSDRRPASPAVLAGTVVAAVVLLLVAGALALFVDGAGWGDWKRVQQHEEVSDALRTAPAAAERAAATILAYDHESLEADRDAAAALMTPDYRKEYVETFDELVLEPARERKAQVEADVRASGVAATGPDRVEVLLFVNQTTVSTANGGEPQTALNRVVLAMEQVDGTWLVDGITSY